MQIQPTVIIVLDKRHVKKNGQYPLKLRITFQKIQQYYPLGYDLFESDFLTMNRLTAGAKGVEINLKRKLNEVAFKCEKQKIRAVEIVNKMPRFDFRIFEKKFYDVSNSRKSIFSFYEHTINSLENEGRVGTASNYRCSMNSIKRFSSKTSIHEITVEFLRDYENYLKKEGKSISTVGIYLRPLRALLNQAIEEGEFSKEQYPFGKRRYQIPSSNNIKKALSLKEIGLIYNHESKGEEWVTKAKDIFMFSYFGNGINIKDILRLKFGNIDGPFIRFTRAKTERTTRHKSSKISFALSQEIIAIIDRWGNKNTSPENFIFPVLNDGLSPIQEMKIVQQFTKMVNKYVNVVVKEVGIDKHISSYFARHSFATVLYRSGISTELISESLGHSSLKTTANYLGSFDDKKREVLVDTLRSFKNVINPQQIL